MSEPIVVAVKPIYGWGWVISGQPRFAVPEPFSVRLDGGTERSWSGVVLDPRHEFTGQRVTLTQRDQRWSGDVNVVVQPAYAGGQPSKGFAVLAARPRWTAAGTGSPAPDQSSR
ncbi:MAG: hypothetical protein U1E53_08295 [Dongiaceae bacterium]